MLDRRTLAAAALALVASLAGWAAAAVAEPVEQGPSAEEGAAALEVYDPLFDDEEDPEELENDPFESANRMTFAFNQEVDYWVLDPLTRGYQWLVPGPVRRGVNRVFDNLNSPVIFANEVLQLRPQPAARTLTRFVVNTSFGLGGIFDFGDEVMGLPRGEADFGQTLARYHVPRGPYLVVPLIGPSTARDAVGTVVDQALDPLTYIVGPLNFQWQLILGSGQGLALRDANLDALDALRDASVDFYSALRSAYLQTRRARELEALGNGSLPEEAEASVPVDPLPSELPDQELVPEASFSMRSSIAAISASKSSRFTMPENSERRSASSLTVPSR